MEYVKTTMIDWLFTALAPHRCCSCGEIGALLCERCKSYVSQEPFSGCILCRRPCGQRGLCGRCANQLDCQQAWCVGERSDTLKLLLDAYKFSSSRAGVAVLTDLLDDALPLLPPDITLVGVPTSATTRRVRGFDHIALIVDALAKRRQLAVAYPLTRVSNQTLHFLPKKERLKLGPTLFQPSGQPVPNKVLLVDDIVTTGTTLRTAARLLKAGGVENLYIAVVARQPEKEK